MPSEIRVEFEKAFEKDFDTNLGNRDFLHDVALWAAKWMAERCIDKMAVTNSEILLAAGELTASEIRTVKAVLSWKCSQLRQLAKELGGQP